MFTFFSTAFSDAKNVAEAQLNEISGNLLGIMRFAARHPLAFTGLVLGTLVANADACYLIYCQYQDNSSLLAPNVEPLPANLTEYCTKINPATPSFPVEEARSLDIGNSTVFCEYACGNTMPYMKP